MEKEKIERLKKWLRGNKQGPYKLDFFLTQACNLNCMFCDCHNVSYKKLKRELNKKDFLRIIKEAKTMGVKNVGILGGEPFVKTDIMIDVMKAIKENDMAGSLTTNGTLFTKESINQIIEMGWDMVRFSIDGRRRIHDYLRGQRGAYNKAVKNLLLFKEFKQMMNKKNPTIEFNFVLTNKNYRDLPFVVKLADKVDCKKFYILPLIELTENCSDLMIKEMNEGIKRYLIKALTLAEKSGIESNIQEIINTQVVENSSSLDKEYNAKAKDNTLYCLQPWHGLAIHSNGNAVPCANFDDFSGESVEGTSLKEIWYGRYMNRIRKNIKEGNLPKFCSRCCMPLVVENKRLKEELNIK